MSRVSHVALAMVNGDNGGYSGAHWVETLTGGSES